MHPFALLGVEILAVQNIAVRMRTLICTISPSQLFVDFHVVPVPLVVMFASREVSFKLYSFIGAKY